MNIERKIRVLTISSLVFYVIIVLWITILKCNIEAAVHGVRIFLEPMSIGERFAYATTYFSTTDSMDMILNVFIFIPLGIFIPLLKGRSAPVTTIALAVLSSFAIESLQLILAFGYFTYIDVISNTSGAVLGIIIHALFIRRITDEKKMRALTFFNGLLIAITVFSVINTALNIDIYL